MDILDSNKSIYEILAHKRAMLEQQAPDVARQLPALAGATQPEKMFKQDQNQPAQDFAATVQQITAPLVQSSLSPNAKPKEVQEAMDASRRVTGYLDPMTPKETFGPNWGKALGMGDNAGGILGLGIQPIDLLAFAIGAGITSNMPQDKALSTTMYIAGLPKQFRDNQEKSALDFVKRQQEQVQLALSGENLAQRQLENAQKAEIYNRKRAVVGMITNQLATGQPLTPAQQKVVGVLGSDVGIDGGVLKELMVPDINVQYRALRALQQQAEADGLGRVSGTFDLPGGQKVTIGSAGGSALGRPVVTGEIGDAIVTGQITDRLKEAGLTSPEKLRQSYEMRKAEERTRIGISQQNSERAQAALELVRPEESKKLAGFKELHFSVNDMLSKYDAILKERGGKLNPSVQIAIQMATTSPDTFIGKGIQALGQRFPGLTQADFDFISRYASMQKFARGLLNDVGNLSNFERGIANTIIGTPLDVTGLFRSRMGTASGDAARAYETEFNSLRKTRDLSAFPSVLGAPQQGQQAPSGQLSDQGQQFLQELKKAMGKK